MNVLRAQLQQRGVLVFRTSKFPIDNFLKLFLKITFLISESYTRTEWMRYFKGANCLPNCGKL